MNWINKLTWKEHTMYTVVLRLYVEFLSLDYYLIDSQLEYILQNYIVPL